MFKNVCANLFIKAQLWKWAKYLSYHHTMELKVMLIEEYLMVMEKCSYYQAKIWSYKIYMVSSHFLKHVYVYTEKNYNFFTKIFWHAFISKLYTANMYHCVFINSECYFSKILKMHRALGPEVLLPKIYSKEISQYSS